MKSVAIIFLMFVFAGRALSQENIPDIQDVQKAALDYARIRPDELSDMKRRSRIAAALPKLQVATRRTMQDDIDISISDNVSVTSSGVSVGPETSDLNQSSNNDTYFEVKAVWSLNELVFSRDMLDVAEEARYQIRERRQILAEVNKLYFERQRLLAELSLIKGGGIKAKEVDLIRSHVNEITADLDALTGGWFSNRIKD